MPSKIVEFEELFADSKQQDIYLELEREYWEMELFTEFHLPKIVTIETKLKDLTAELEQIIGEIKSMKVTTSNRRKMAMLLFKLPDLERLLREVQMFSTKVNSTKELVIQGKIARNEPVIFTEEPKTKQPGGFFKLLIALFRGK